MFKLITYFYDLFYTCVYTILINILILVLNVNILLFNNIMSWQDQRYLKFSFVKTSNIQCKNGVDTNGISIGKDAGLTNQGTNSISLGNLSGRTNQQENAVAIGANAGQGTQGTKSVAIGLSCGQSNQSENAVAIGNQSGQINQGMDAVAIGKLTGQTGQGRGAIAIGSFLIHTTQGIHAVSIGNQTSQNNQGINAISIGGNTGRVGQANNAIAFGLGAGRSNQNNNAIAFGLNAGQGTQGVNAIAIGVNAGRDNQGANAVACGSGASQSNQGDSVAIGINTGVGGFARSGCVLLGFTASGGFSNSISIGFDAARNGCATNAILIGANIGKDSAPRANAVAIGGSSLGNNGIYTVPTNAIVISASSTVITPSTASATYIRPVRIGTAGARYNIMLYSPNTNEVLYSTSDSSGNKTFVIENPNDVNKYLVHGCLEGPEGGVYYRGKGEITNNEFVTICLPEYVKKIAIDFTIQLTQIYCGKQIKQLYTSRVENNRFTVFGENCKFYWLVQGKRCHIEIEPYKKDVKLKGDGPYKWI